MGTAFTVGEALKGTGKKPIPSTAVPVRPSPSLPRDNLSFSPFSPTFFQPLPLSFNLSTIVAQAFRHPYPMSRRDSARRLDNPDKFIGIELPDFSWFVTGLTNASNTPMVILYVIDNWCIQFCPVAPFRGDGSLYGLRRGLVRGLKIRFFISLIIFVDIATNEGCHL